MIPPRSQVEVRLGVLAAGLLALAALFARGGIPAWIPPAPTVRLGVPSPLSGMTRSFVAFARGDLAEAFAWHPLGPVVFVACAFAAAAALLAVARVQPPERVRRVVAARALWLGVAASFALAWARQIVVLDV